MLNETKNLEKRSESPLGQDKLKRSITYETKDLIKDLEVF